MTLCFVLYVWRYPASYSHISTNCTSFFFIRYFLHLHFKCYPKSPLYPPPALLPYLPTPTSWPWHSPVLGHIIFTRPRAFHPIDGQNKIIVAVLAYSLVFVSYLGKNWHHHIITVDDCIKSRLLLVNFLFHSVEWTWGIFHFLVSLIMTSLVLYSFHFQSLY